MKLAYAPALFFTTSSFARNNPSTVAFSSIIMPRGVKKEHLPSKLCVMCQRPFNWRKKWESCWDEVTTCSKSCNRHRRADKQQQTARLRSTLASAQNEATTEADQQIVLSDAESENGTVSSRKHAPDSLEQTIFDEECVASSIDCADAPASTDDECQEALDPKTARKAAKKLAKLERRAKREGRADPSHGQKSCDICQKSVNLLIRCTIDASGEWKMVCGKCWHPVSGGVVDGDADHPHYRYGGLWKNRSRSA